MATTNIDRNAIGMLHDAGVTDDDIKQIEDNASVSEDEEEDECLVEIYIATNKINNKKYCGQAKCKAYNGRPHGTQGRWKAHVYEAFARNGVNKCHVLNRAILKHGPAAFDVKTIFTVPIAEADQKEIDIIKENNSQVPNGYNITAGGGGRRGCKHTQEELEKNSKAKRREGYEHLPMYIAEITPVPGVIGYGVFPQDRKKGRAFTSMQMTMEKKLALAKEYLHAILNNKPTEMPAHNKDLPKYIHYRPARGNRKDGLRVEIKVNKKVVFCKDTYAGTFEEKLAKAKGFVQQAVDADIIPAQK